jgi:hypothetical protein
MKLNELELAILVKGRPILEYQHQGQTFVEGRAGSEYEIEVHNHTYQRVEAVLSVDGLSVLDGKPAGHQSRGYLINPRGVIRIPGWLLDSLTVAKFAFSGMPQSYAAQSGNDARNNGVIGAMVFREKPLPLILPFTPPYSPWPTVSPTIGSPLRGFAPSTNMTWSSASSVSSAGGGGMSSGMGLGAGDLVGGAAPSAQCYNAAINQGVSPEVNLNANFVEQSLGTAFGDAKQFSTYTVAFERGDVLATLLCYYDEKRGLKARGIKIPRQARQKPPQPQAFPAGLTGCQPPPHWQP